VVSVILTRQAEADKKWEKIARGLSKRIEQLERHNAMLQELVVNQTETLMDLTCKAGRTIDGIAKKVTLEPEFVDAEERQEGGDQEQEDEDTDMVEEGEIIESRPAEEEEARKAKTYADAAKSVEHEDEWEVIRNKRDIKKEKIVRKEAERAAAADRSKVNPPPARPTTYPLQDRTWVLTRTATHTVNPTKMCQELDAVLRQKNAPVAIVSGRFSHKGNLVFETRPDCKAAQLHEYEADLIKAAQRYDESVKVAEAQEEWFKCLVHDVDMVRYPDCEEGLRLLGEQLVRHNVGLQLACLPRYLSGKARDHQATGSVIIAFRNARAARSFRERVRLDGQVKRTVRYWQARPSDQCNNCYAFGHHPRRCRAPPTCGICAESHRTEDHQCKELKCTLKGRTCKHTIPKCANCTGPHSAFDKQCPTVQKFRPLKKNTEPEDASDTAIGVNTPTTSNVN
jgi:hypothetical protein